MILADTSIWADHFRSADSHLVELLGVDEVLMHPFVLAEISLGNLHNRHKSIADLLRLPTAKVLQESAALQAITTLKLHGTGIGFVDVHILLSVRLNGHLLWTRDKRLAMQAARLGVQYHALQ